MTDRMVQHSVVWSAMAAAEQRALREQMETLYSHNFAHDSSLRMSDWFAEPGLEQVQVALYRARGTLVGFHILSRYRLALPVRVYRVFRSRALIMPDYRARDGAAGFGARAILRYRLRHPGRRILHAGTLMNPVAYHVIARRARTVWPHIDRPTPPRMVAVMEALADQWGLACSDARPYVTREPYALREDPADARRCRESTSRYVRFYLRVNPAYADGYGLLTVVPITWSNALDSTVFALARRRWIWG